MSKYFYAVVPFSAVEDERNGLTEKMFRVVQVEGGGRDSARAFSDIPEPTSAAGRACVRRVVGNRCPRYDA